MVTRSRFLFWADELRFSSYFSAPTVSWSGKEISV